LSKLDNDMWYCTFEKLPVEINLTIKSIKSIGGMYIWNYNKSLQDSIIGVKEIEVFINEKNVWKGEIKKAGNKNDVLYGTEIILTPNLHLNIVNNMIEEIENNN
jgi:hypothetical protein